MNMVCDETAVTLGTMVTGCSVAAFDVYRMVTSVFLVVAMMLQGFTDQLN